jgi:hypothetical protein
MVSYAVFLIPWTDTVSLLVSSPNSKHKALIGEPRRSWASIDGNIESACLVYSADEKDILIRVHSIQTSLVSQNIYGQVKDGYIKISGQLAKVSAVAHKRINDDVAPFYKLKVNTHAGDSIAVEGEVYQDSTFENGSYVWDSFEDLYYIPVRQIANKPGRTEGILLEAVEDRNGLFRRFGTFNAGSPAGNTDGLVFERAFESFGPYAEELGLESCQDTLGNEERTLYTITII